jgi:archaeal flagellin N-terminal-like domain
MLDQESRGQVGIGTLIVFIAMVLVAAIAAGVLINTAGLLQAQAQQTGEETTAEVSNIFQIGEVVGSETTGNKKLDVLNASVRLSSGSDPINVSKASYTIETGDNATVVDGNANINNGIELFPIQSLDDNTQILSEQDDLMVIQFTLDNLTEVNQLAESESIKIVAQAPAGGSTHTQLQAPRRIENDNSYLL